MLDYLYLCCLILMKIALSDVGLKKREAKILKAEGVRIEPKELTVKSFELQASMHLNVKNPVWHISLNF